MGDDRIPHACHKKLAVTPTARRLLSSSMDTCQCGPILSWHVKHIKCGARLEAQSFPCTFHASVSASIITTREMYVAYFGRNELSRAFSIVLMIAPRGFPQVCAMCSHDVLHHALVVALGQSLATLIYMKAAMAPQCEFSCFVDSTPFMLFHLPNRGFEIFIRPILLITCGTRAFQLLVRPLKAFRPQCATFLG